MTREEYIAKRRKLFWYTPEDKLYNISDNFLMETIFNYGTMDDVLELFKLQGVDNLARTFSAVKGRMVGNYFPEIYHFFDLVLKRYAQRNS